MMIKIFSTKEVDSIVSRAQRLLPMMLLLFVSMDGAGCYSIINMIIVGVVVDDRPGGGWLAWCVLPCLPAC